MGHVFTWHPSRDGAPARVLRDVALLLAVITGIAHAWISDDALITLRSVTNAVVGNGPTFNPVEMVQSYTHPLWFVLLTAANSVVLAPIHWAALLGLAAYLGLLLQLVRAANGDHLLGGALVLTAASLPSVVEWTTSGLENSLAMFLVASLALATLEDPSKFGPVRVGLLAAALFLTRLDLVLIAAPLTLSWAWRRHPREVLLAALIGSVPIGVWLTWAQVTYGAVLPNTYFAKLNVDIPGVELATQGVSYLRLAFARHPLLTLVVLGAVSVLSRSRGALRQQARVAVIGAIGLHLAYVIRIGGDFMEGRFLGVVAVLALVALGLEVRRTRTTDEVPHERQEQVPVSWAVSERALTGTLVVGILVALSAGMPVPWRDEGLTGGRWEYGQSGYALIVDERGFYVGMGQSFWTSHEIRRLENELRSFTRVDGAPERVVSACGGLGRLGVESGPSTHIVDVCALTDPVLARIPYRERAFNWRVGHYPRPLPEGYLEAVRTGDPDLILDPEVREIARSVWATVRR